MTQVEYAEQSYWDGYLKDTDLDWRGLWTQPFIRLLQSARANDVLELGCRSGHDAARPAREGFHVVAIDISAEALAQAEKRYRDIVQFRPVDMARGSPFLVWQLRCCDCQRGAAHVLGHCDPGGLR